MVVGGGGAGDVPAGYTYLGQFIDHDLTMDRTDVMFGDDVRPVDLLQGRSPRLDLDSLYGNGPGDAASAKFYARRPAPQDRYDDRDLDPTAAKAGHDLPRVGTGPNKAAKRKALIPDPRNDENLVVAQTHLAMIHFHNKVARQGARVGAGRRAVHPRPQAGHAALPVDDPARLPAADLPPPPSLDDVFTNGRKLVEPDAVPTVDPDHAVEFSVAAFRLGHSMIRGVVQLEPALPRHRRARWTSCSRSPAPAATCSATIRLPSNWIADWRRMYDFPAGGRPGSRRPAATSTTRCGSTPG